MVTPKPDLFIQLLELGFSVAAAVAMGFFIVLLIKYILESVVGQVQSIHLIVQNLDNDPVRVYRRIYDSLYSNLDASTIPHAVVILGDYQYKAAFVADQEINLLACLTELMGVVKFK